MKWAETSYDVYLKVQNYSSILSKFSVYQEPKGAHPFRRGVLDSFLKLSSGRTISSLFGLTLREWENYLRDRNDEPAISEDELLEKGVDDVLFLKWKVKLASAILVAQGEPVDLAPLQTIESLNPRHSRLVSRISWVQDYLKTKTNPVLSGAGAKARLVDWQFGELVLSLEGPLKEVEGGKESVLEFFRYTLLKDIPSVLLEGALRDGEELKVVAQ